ncbi:MAG TPA: hypothetical protein VMV52_07615 [Candidatus Nanopelagicaceae bacterium]|nr:hypothetical protein [Candidatus Nanopelagicaceae bacterium]
MELRIGTFTKSLLIDIARSTGKLERAGIEVAETSVASSPAQFAALESDEFDLVITSPDNAIAYRFLEKNPLNRNISVQILAAIDRGLGLSLALGPQVLDIEAVRGRVVGVDVPNSGFAFLAYALLDRAGIHPGDYDVTALGSTPRRTSALISGKCAATVLNAGNELRAEGAGCKIISRATELGPYLGTVLVAMETNDPARQASFLNFAQVLLETSREIVGGNLEAEVIAAAGSLLDLSESEARDHYKCLLDSKEGLITDGKVDRAAISTLIQLRAEYLPCAELDSIQDSIDELVIDDALG